MLSVVMSSWMLCVLLNIHRGILSRKREKEEKENKREIKGKGNKREKKKGKRRKRGRYPFFFSTLFSFFI